MPGQCSQPDETWDDIAEGWAKWWPLLEAPASPSNECLVETAALKPGDRVLDLASGIGDPAAAAARAVGPEGQVVATDASPTMVRLGQDRMTKLGLQNVDFRVLDAHEMDFAEQSFDAVLCRWGFMFMRDLDAVLDKIRHSLKPGGRLATAVWPPQDQAPSIGFCDTALRETFGIPLPGPDDRTAFHLSDIDTFLARLRRAQFRDLDRRPVTLTYRFQSAEEFVACRREMTELGRLFRQRSQEDQAAAWRMMKKALAPYRAPDGTIAMENVTVCISGRRSEA